MTSLKPKPQRFYNFWFIMMGYRSLALMLFLIGTIAYGCSRQAPAEDVDKAATQFFLRLKAAEYDAIYDDAYEAFKEQNPRDAVKDNLKQIISMGEPLSWNRVSMAFKEEGKKRIVLPVYSVTMQQNSSYITLKFVDDGGQWKLLGFAVSPRGLTPKLD
jgi:hypothetical protein